MDFSRRGTVMTLLAALGLAVTAYVGLFVSGVPTIFSPFPVLTVIPALMLSGPPLDYVVVVIPCLLFLLWNPQLMQQEAKIPRRTYILFGLLAVLSILYFAASWKWGLQYQGLQFTAVICSINVAWIGFLTISFRRCLKKAPAFGTSLLIQWMLFAWLSWCAFPWLGELL
jgi:uncharacterized membrane protein YuzA (DUF378 family)